MRLARAGRYYVLVADGAPVSRVQIAFKPYTKPLVADYTPVLAFSDGGAALYTEHFALAPLKDEAAAQAMPADLNEIEIEQEPMVLRVEAPGSGLMVGGTISRDVAEIPTDRINGYVYVGEAPLISTASFAGMIDPGLPPWIRAELDGFTPRLMQLYTRRLGKPAGTRPMALVAWGGAAARGWSLSGSVLPGMVVMHLSGTRVVERSPTGLASVRWFIGHETAHFWIGQTIRYNRRAEGWITEGGADLLAIRALDTLAPGYDSRSELQQKLDECLKLNGPGEPLATAEVRGEHGAEYACGALLTLAAEAAERKRDPKSDVFTWLRRLIDANREDGIITAGEWLATFAKISGDPATAERVRTYLHQGESDPAAFFAELFTATGVRFARDGDKLALR